MKYFRFTSRSFFVNVTTNTTVLSIFLLHLIDVGHSQVQLMSIFDPWAEQIKSVLKNFKRLELDALQFSLPFQNKNISQVQFHLYTYKNPIRSQLLIPNNLSSIENSYFQKENPTKILIHGYSQNQRSFDFPQQIKDAYFLQQINNNKSNNISYNIICIDWSVLSKEINYFDSANYTSYVGKYIGEFIFGLKSCGFINEFEELHLVGFSLGAHVSGIVGHYIAERTLNMSKIGRITGLDPAQPGFLSVPTMHRLDSQDAHFVDIIHTNMGHLLFGDLGMTLNSGHADFFPNGGRRQPSCEYSLLTEYSIPRKSTCSHVKAADYFKKSILGERYVACNNCKDWESFKRGFCPCDDDENGSMNTNGSNNTSQGVLMGEFCDFRARGEFYLFAK